jgi:hypothetical protein
MPARVPTLDKHSLERQNLTNDIVITLAQTPLYDLQCFSPATGAAQAVGHDGFGIARLLCE